MFHNRHSFHYRECILCEKKKGRALVLPKALKLFINEFHSVFFTHFSAYNLVEFHILFIRFITNPVISKWATYSFPSMITPHNNKFFFTTCISPMYIFSYNFICHKYHHPFIIVYVFHAKKKRVRRL
nr:MAG TPA: hypothetical protein [Caudoviricetes sp.]